MSVRLTRMMTGLLAFAWITAVHPGRAEPSRTGSPEVRALAPDLADLPLGRNRAALRSWIGGHMAQHHAQAIAAASDLAEKARLKGLQEAEVDRILGAEVAFTGARTPWDASLLTGEFGHGSGESLVVWRDVGDVHFFFLAGGLLWKYARTLDASTSQAERLADWQRRLARAPDQSVRIDDGRGERRVWETRRLTLALLDRRMAHGGDLLVIADREAEKNLAARRKAGPDTPAKADGPDPLQDFLLGPGEE